MILNQKVIVVMPAYNAERTIEKTCREVMDQQVVDLIVVVDDGSQDATVSLARTFDKVVVHAHPRNMGYGGNQKTCYRLALDHGADIVVMVHADYQYTPKLIPAMAGSSRAACTRACWGRGSSEDRRSRAACRPGATSPTAA